MSKWPSTYIWVLGGSGPQCSASCMDISLPQRHECLFKKNCFQAIWWMKMEPNRNVTFNDEMSLYGKDHVLIDGISICHYAFDRRRAQVLCR